MIEKVDNERDVKKFRFKAVSYTHLDVYKRQKLHAPAADRVDLRREGMGYI